MLSFSDIILQIVTFWDCGLGSKYCLILSEFHKNITVYVQCSQSPRFVNLEHLKDCPHLRGVAIYIVITGYAQCIMHSDTLQDTQVQERSYS